MSLNVHELTLANGKVVQLRLTAKGIKSYAEKRKLSDAAPLAVVMGAVQSMDAMIDLLTCALKFNGSPKDQMSDGADLIDHLADEGKGDRFLRGLVVRLAADAGLLSDSDVDALSKAMDDNSDLMVAGLVKLLGYSAALGDEEDPT